MPSDPNIVSFRCCGANFLALEDFQATSVYDVMEDFFEAGKQLSIEQIAHITVEVTAGLKYLHSLRILVRTQLVEKVYLFHTHCHTAW